jgi:Mtf2 family
MSRSNAASRSGRREYGTDAGPRNTHQCVLSAISKRLLIQICIHSSTAIDKNERLSAWDHIFEGVDDEPSVGAFSTRGALAPPAFSSARRPKRSRPTMTAREISAFDKMFDMIFTAVSDKRKESFTTAAVQVQPTSRQPYTDDVYGEPESSLHSDADASRSSVPPDAEAAASASAQVGLSPPGEAFDLFGRLRRQSNRMRQTSATAERLDRQKEEVELCQTDQQLLEWTVRELFQGDHSPEPAPPSSSPSSSSPQTSEEIARYLANPTYPYLLAHVMHTFRLKYNDPHTALALFAHAKRRSIHSYVFGCTTPAYNELLETRWELDGALKGVEEALIEMRANGVRPDKGTRAFVECVRREVGERFLSRKGVDIDGEVWEVLERVEALVANKKKSERGAGGGKGSDAQINRNSKLEARKRHWNEEWKTEDTGPFRLGEDRLTLS